MEQSVNLFGERTQPKQLNIKRKNLFSDYEGFVDKFDRKKTTDDCYTPTEVYDCIVNYVARKVDISVLEIIRPFFPDMDYTDMEYFENHVVIDNPPFSIISEITRFYVENGVKFFLFAPHLTLFGADIDCTHIVCGADVKYENGAIVKTSFLTNMFGNISVLGDAELYQELTRINEGKNPTASLPKYKYPANVLTVSSLHKLVIRGVSMSFSKSDVAHCKQLDSQKKHGKSLFGAGYLISDKSAAEKSAAEKSAAEKSAAEKSAAEKEAEGRCYNWELSDREIEIVKKLG